MAGSIIQSEDGEVPPSIDVLPEIEVLPDEVLPDVQVPQDVEVLPEVEVLLYVEATPIPNHPDYNAKFAQYVIIRILSDVVYFDYWSCGRKISHLEWRILFWNLSWLLDYIANEVQSALEFIAKIVLLLKFIIKVINVQNLNMGVFPHSPELYKFLAKFASLACDLLNNSPSEKAVKDHVQNVLISTLSLFLLDSKRKLTKTLNSCRSAALANTIFIFTLISKECKERNDCLANMCGKIINDLNMKEDFVQLTSDRRCFSVQKMLRLPSCRVLYRFFQKCNENMLLTDYKENSATEGNGENGYDPDYEDDAPIYDLPHNINKIMLKPPKDKCCMYFLDCLATSAVDLESSSTMPFTDIMKEAALLDTLSIELTLEEMLDIIPYSTDYGRGDNNTDGETPSSSDSSSTWEPSRFDILRELNHGQWANYITITIDESSSSSSDVELVETPSADQLNRPANPMLTMSPFVANYENCNISESDTLRHEDIRTQLLIKAMLVTIDDIRRDITDTEIYSTPIFNKSDDLNKTHGKDNTPKPLEISLAAEETIEESVEELQLLDINTTTFIAHSKIHESELVGPAKVTATDVSMPYLWVDSQICSDLSEIADIFYPSPLPAVITASSQTQEAYLHSCTIKTTETNFGFSYTVPVKLPETCFEVVDPLHYVPPILSTVRNRIVKDDLCRAEIISNNVSIGLRFVEPQYLSEVLTEKLGPFIRKPIRRLETLYTLQQPYLETIRASQVEVAVPLVVNNGPLFGSIEPLDLPTQPNRYKLAITCSILPTHHNTPVELPSFQMPVHVPQRIIVKNKLKQAKSHRVQVYCPIQHTEVHWGTFEVFDATHEISYVTTSTMQAELYQAQHTQVEILHSKIVQALKIKVPLKLLSKKLCKYALNKKTISNDKPTSKVVKITRRKRQGGYKRRQHKRPNKQHTAPNEPLTLSKVSKIIEATNTPLQIIPISKRNVTKDANFKPILSSFEFTPISKVDLDTKKMMLETIPTEPLQITKSVTDIGSPSKKARLETPNLQDEQMKLKTIPFKKRKSYHEHDTEIIQVPIPVIKPKCKAAKPVDVEQPVSITCRRVTRSLTARLKLILPKVPVFLPRNNTRTRSKGTLHDDDADEVVYSVTEEYEELKNESLATSKKVDKVSKTIAEAESVDEKLKNVSERPKKNETFKEKVERVSKSVDEQERLDNFDAYIGVGRLSNLANNPYGAYSSSPIKKQLVARHRQRQALLSQIKEATDSKTEKTPPSNNTSPLEASLQAHTIHLPQNLLELTSVPSNATVTTPDANLQERSLALITKEQIAVTSVITTYSNSDVKFEHTSSVEVTSFNEYQSPITEQEVEDIEMALVTKVPQNDKVQEQDEMQVTSISKDLENSAHEYELTHRIADLQSPKQHNETVVHKPSTLHLEIQDNNLPFGAAEEIGGPKRTLAKLETIQFMSSLKVDKPLFESMKVIVERLPTFDNYGQFEHTTIPSTNQRAIETGLEMHATPSTTEFDSLDVQRNDSFTDTIINDILNGNVDIEDSISLSDSTTMLDNLVNDYEIENDLINNINPEGFSEMLEVNSDIVSVENIMNSPTGNLPFEYPQSTILQTTTIYQTTTSITSVNSNVKDVFDRYQNPRRYTTDPRQAKLKTRTKSITGSIKNLESVNVNENSIVSKSDESITSFSLETFNPKPSEFSGINDPGHGCISKDSALQLIVPEISKLLSALLSELYNGVGYNVSLTNPMAINKSETPSPAHDDTIKPIEIQQFGNLQNTQQTQSDLEKHTALETFDVTNVRKRKHEYEEKNYTLINYKRKKYIVRDRSLMKNKPSHNIENKFGLIQTVKRKSIDDIVNKLKRKREIEECPLKVEQKCNFANLQPDTKGEFKFGTVHDSKEESDLTQKCDPELNFKSDAECGLEGRCDLEGNTGLEGKFNPERNFNTQGQYNFEGVPQPRTPSPAHVIANRDMSENTLPIEPAVNVPLAQPLLNLPMWLYPPSTITAPPISTVTALSYPGSSNAITNLQAYNTTMPNVDPIRPNLRMPDVFQYLPYLNNQERPQYLPPIVPYPPGLNTAANHSNMLQGTPILPPLNPWPQSISEPTRHKSRRGAKKSKDTKKLKCQPVRSESVSFLDQGIPSQNQMRLQPPANYLAQDLYSLNNRRWDSGLNMGLTSAFNISENLSRQNNFQLVGNNYPPQVGQGCDCDICRAQNMQYLGQSSSVRGRGRGRRQGKG